MTKESLTKAKLVASRLSSRELYELRSWADERAQKRFRQEKILEMKSYPVGARLVMGNVPRFPAFSGEVVVVVAHRRTRMLVEIPDSGHKGLLLPYSNPWLIKGVDSADNLALARTEVEMNQKLVPVINKMIEGKLT